MKKEYCYWCGEILQNKSFRRYIGLDGDGKNVYAFFCDDICIECLEYNAGVENGFEVADTIKNEEPKRVKNGYKAKRCATCGWGGKAKEFSCKISINVNRGNNSGQKIYCCNKECLQKVIKEIADGEREI